MVGGVCGAAARRLGWDITIVRVIFVVAALSGFPIAVYVLGWLLIPLEGETSTIASRALSDLRGILIVIAFIPLLVVALLVASALGAGWIGNFAWPILISAAGLVLIWRNGTPYDRAVLQRTVKPFAELFRPGGPSVLSIRLALGILLLAGGLSALLAGHSTRAALRPLGGVVLVVAAIVVIFGPWWLRLGRDLVGERQARARAEERADMAARVHDSVLQTLALIQRQSDRPQDVVQLARAQERELRRVAIRGETTRFLQRGGSHVRRRRGAHPTRGRGVPRCPGRRRRGGGLPARRRATDAARCGKRGDCQCRQVVGRACRVPLRRSRG